MGREWGSFEKPSAGRPPTRWLGESAVQQLRVSGFKCFELVHQGVVLGVIDGRGVENVILVFMMAKQVVQGGDTRLWIVRGNVVAWRSRHGRDYSG